MHAGTQCLENQARVAAALTLLLLLQRSPGGDLEDVTNTLSSASRALNVATSTDLAGDLATLLGGDRGLRGAAEHLDGSGVVTQVDLAANQDDGNAAAVVKGLCVPLLLDVLQGIRGVNREADEQHVRIGVRKRSESVEVLLTSSIPKGEGDVAAIDDDLRHVVLEHGRDVLGGELIASEDNEKRGLTGATVTDDHEFSAGTALVSHDKLLRGGVKSELLLRGQRATRESKKYFRKKLVAQVITKRSYFSDKVRSRGV